MKKKYINIYHFQNLNMKKGTFLWKALFWRRLPWRYRKHIKTILFWLFWNILRYKGVKNINLFEDKIYSQNGEDGIIQMIFNKIGVTNKFFVEFGIHPNQGNTIYLKKEKGWKGLWIDGNGDGKDIKKEFITKENINKLFDKYNVPNEFDLLSIDIDGNDYYIWKSIRNSPRIVVIEYNASIPPNQSKAIKYDPMHKWKSDDYFGASLLALVKLSKKKGYTLIGCDKRGINAFFVRNDLIKNNFLVQDINKLFKPSGYPHPKSDRIMIDI
jgi:hypothetical protein